MGTIQLVMDDSSLVISDQLFLQAKKERAYYSSSVDFFLVKIDITIDTINTDTTINKDSKVSMW